MAKNKIQDGKIITCTAPVGGVMSGVPCKIGQLLVIPVTSAAEGEEFEGDTEGVYDCPKATGAAWSDGALLYWNDSNKNFQTTGAAGTRLAGSAHGDAASGDATGAVRLTGVPAADEA